MKAQIILAAKSFKNNNPHTSLNLETCRFKRLKELLNEPDVFIGDVGYAVKTVSWTGPDPKIKKGEKIKGGLVIVSVNIIDE